MSTMSISEWVTLVEKKKKMMMDPPSTPGRNDASQVMKNPPPAPIESEEKIEYEDLEAVAKKLFQDDSDEELDDEEDDAADEDDEDEAEDNNIRNCTTTGCLTTFIPKSEDVRRCDECRQHNIAKVSPCAYPDCEDYAKMTHKHVKENKTFKFCFFHSNASKFTPVFTYDKKCKTEECEGRIQLNQDQLDFYNQPHMKMRLFCRDCIQVKKTAKDTEIECDCATCDNKVSLSQMQKNYLEKSNHLIGCSDCRKPNRICANNKCKKEFHSISREADMKRKFKDKFTSPICCSKECFELQKKQFILHLS